MGQPTFYLLMGTCGGFVFSCSVLSYPFGTSTKVDIGVLYPVQIKWEGQRWELFFPPFASASDTKLMFSWIVYSLLPKRLVHEITASIMKRLLFARVNPARFEYCQRKRSGRVCAQPVLGLL